jgi:hypothetical protein
VEKEDEELSKDKEKVDWSLSEYLYDHNESDYSYLHDYTVVREISLWTSKKGLDIACRYD